MSRCLVLGSGGWGTALALVLQGNGQDVTLWGHTPEKVDRMRETRDNEWYLPGIPIPESIELVSGYDLDPSTFEAIVSVVPTQHINDVVSHWTGKVPEGMPVVSCSKGLEQNSGRRPTEIISDAWPGARLSVLSGPTHAEEVARKAPASVVVAALEDDVARMFQELFMSDRFRLYTSNDLLGVELGGVLKNCIALAAGICDGLKLGDNAKSALLARGLVEMGRFIESAGGRKNTVFGMSGLGDLITTSFSPHGRNRSVGERVGAGETLDEVLASMSKVAEGVWSVPSVLSQAESFGIEMPIVRQVSHVLFEQKDPMEGVSDLMLRGAKSETEDLF